MLKRLLHIVFILLLLCACGHHAYSPSLQRADSLCSTCPDSALLLLQQLKPKIAKNAVADRMFYELLCIKAADKADRPITQCDSTILRLIDYYENGGDPAKLAETYYYAGRVFYEKQDAPQALDYFLKGFDNIALCDDSVRVKSVLLSQIGYIYFYQGMFNEALKWADKAIEYAKNTQDTLSLIYGYRDAASASIENKDYDKAEKYLIKSISLAKSIDKKDLLYSCYDQLACVYIEMGNFVEARKLLEPVLKDEFPALKSSAYAIASSVFWGLEKYDSSAYFANKVLEVGNIYAKETASKRLANISLKHSDLYAALEYLKQYAQYSDSVKHITNAETVARVNALYHFNRQEKENNRLKIERSKHLSLLIIAISLLSVSVLLITAILINYRRKEEISKSKLDRLNKSLERQKLQNYDFIAANETKIKELESKIKHLDTQNEDLIRQLRIEQEKLKEANQMSALEIRNMERKNSSLSEFPIYHTIKSKANASKIYNKSLSEEEWNELDKTVNSVFDSFSDTLLGHSKLSKHEYGVCLLLKIGLTSSEISRLTNRSLQAINSTRSRLFFKFFGKKGSAAEWDKFIKSI